MKKPMSGLPSGSREVLKTSNKEIYVINGEEFEKVGV